MKDSSEIEYFGTLLQRYRRRAELSQRALSSVSTISVRAVRNLELGQVARPRRETVQLLANALNLTAQERVVFEKAAGNDAGEAEFQSLIMTANGATRRLYGRDRELDILRRRILSQHQGISSISGLAGVGKTQLAVAVAKSLRLTNAMMTLWVQVRSGVDEETSPGRGLLASAGGVNRMVRQIGSQSALLIIDGNDGGEVTCETMWTLVRACPNLRIVETARSSHADHEGYRLFLAPLPTPPDSADRETTIAAPAMIFLLELIADLRFNYQPSVEELAKLAEVCRRLDGLPRALESAASWATIISVDEVLAMARDEIHVLATDPSGRFDAATAIHDAVMAQPLSHRELLCELSNWANGWTVGQVANSLGLSRIRVVSSVQDLLHSGLIVELSEKTDDHIWFDVLNLVRKFLQNRPNKVAQLALPVG
ncbi:helix-turn-helix domain-containing protein [Nocardia brasiliensis]|uniref:helix-turn-helix domain-containing protein n=1 Tax=Nocardia brasiliensis TaxID=37326 RepID=UPI00366C241C